MNWRHKARGSPASPAGDSLLARELLGYGALTSRPTATWRNLGYYWFDATNSILYQCQLSSNVPAWVSISGAGSGDVTAAANLTDNAVVRGDGGAKGVQTSGVLIDDANAVTGAESATIVTNDAGTTNIPQVLTVGHNSSGTPADGFGSSIYFQAESSTTANQNVVQIRAQWATAAHATRKGRLIHYVYDAAAARETMREETNGSAAMIGFLGATAALQQTGDAGTALVTFGLMSGTPTFIGTNVTAASDTVRGTIEIAVQSEMEAGSSTTLAVTPGRQHFHPSAAKCWIDFDASSGTPTTVTSYGVTSITDGGAGVFTINWSVTFSTATHCDVAAGNATENQAFAASTTTTSSRTRNSAGTAVDVSNANIACFGDF